MAGYSPPPPPQAARALVRQLLRGGGRKPVLVATALDDRVGGASSVELVNEGDTAREVSCIATSGDGWERLALGTLAPGESASVRLRARAADDFKCVITGLDNSGRMHIWSYDGRHERLPKHQHLSLEEAARRMYPD